MSGKVFEYKNVESGKKLMGAGEMSKYGGAGWELVACVPLAVTSSFTVYTYIFKRES